MVLTLSTMVSVEGPYVWADSIFSRTGVRLLNPFIEAWRRAGQRGGASRDADTTATTP